jgi:aryl-alcohol dehydrogenase-like predicted oxidoreductase
MWGGSDEAESIKTIRHALDIGINLIDTAPCMDLVTPRRLSERRSRVGTAIKRCWLPR